MGKGRNKLPITEKRKAIIAQFSYHPKLELKFGGEKKTQTFLKRKLRSVIDELENIEE